MVCPTGTTGATGARPGPILFAFHQTRGHGILFYIPDEVSQLFLGPNPVVERLVLPKGQSAAIQNAVRDAAGSALQPPGDGGHWNPRLQNQMHVVRHDDPGTQAIKLPGGVAVPEGLCQHACYSGIAEP